SCEGASRRGKAWDAFEEANPESVLLVASEREQIDGAWRALQSNSAAMELLAGKKQEKLTWFMNDRQCSGIPDVYLPALKRWPDNSSGRVVELKSARSVNPDYFPYDSRKFGYHVQLSWYRNALATLGLVEPNAGCFIVAVES